MKINAIIPCGGSAVRTGLNRNKLLYPIDDIPVITRTVTPFVGIENMTRIILVCAAKDVERITECMYSVKTLSNVELVVTTGGATRTESVRNGLKLLENDCDVVVIHDGARPYIKTEIIENCITSAVKFGSGICCTKPVDTVAVADEINIIQVPDRNKLLMIQTPQAFRRANIVSAYEQAGEKEYSDDSGIYLEFMGKPKFVIGDRDNAKVTYKEDLESYKGIRVGYGFDTHRLVEGRPLILGTVEIPHTKGLLGHSDADVLLHAIMDSLLSAAGLKDIGVQFPDTDERYKDIESIILLRKVRDMVKAEKLQIVSVSAIIIAEKPKLMSYLPQMEAKITRCLGLNKKQFSITCTTTEGLGYVGREEGISCRAVSILCDKDKLV